MVKIKHLVIGLLSGLLLLGAVFWLTRDFWHEQFRAYAKGAVELAADKYCYRLPDIDRVEFSVISAGTASATNGFPELVGGLTYYPIATQKTISGDEAKEFRKRWRAMTFGWGFSGLCHEPAYGLRFFNDKSLVFETTLCWKCSNFYVPTPLGYTYCGFDDKNPQAQAVWELLQKYAPLPEATKTTKK